MIIREFTPGDIAEIRKIHKAAGEPFELPIFTDPLLLVRKCLVDQDDRVKMAAFGRLHISALLFVDGTFETPQNRLKLIHELQDRMDEGARQFGLDIATTQAEGRFAERLEKDLGWTAGYGKMFYRGF